MLTVFYRESVGNCCKVVSPLKGPEGTSCDLGFYHSV